MARLVTGEAGTRVRFESEPTAYRWVFCREGEDIRIRVLELRDGSDHDNMGAEIWSARSPRSPGHVVRKRIFVLGDISVRSPGRDTCCRLLWALRTMSRPPAPDLRFAHADGEA